jgi:DNA-binding NtrC family response regulator
MARRILVRTGYRVLTAADTVEALRLADEEPAPIDLLLTDVIMPGASGKELATQLVLRRPATKVLYMSGYPEDVIVHQGVLERDVNLIEKPFTADALLDKVRDILQAPAPSPLASPGR